MAPPPLPAALRRASAVRRFPPGCGRQPSNASQPPHRLVRFAADDGAPPTPSASWRAARFPGTQGHGRGWGDGSMDGIDALAAAEVIARRASAVRRYPPGCGRSVAAPKPEPLVAMEGEKSEGGAIELLAAVCDVEAKAIAGAQKVALCGSTALEGGESGSNGGVESGGRGGEPLLVAELASSPLLPWAQRGRRSQQRRRCSDQTGCNGVSAGQF
ncbi:hypothetical protein BRADI_1g50980v3 [Brachypodium distachyon]|uniref:Uncharacterized protein n=1 Tax=Brachypodium distachyon TaxID=15368 RepID=I1H1L8_BRADI|nr:hypothetical protein BRADI_1g50980v3 [Brachypodium distachyon]